MLTIKQKIRFIIRGSIALGSYGSAITLLFQKQDLLFSLTAIFVFFIAFHFFYLEIYRYKRKYLAAFLVGGTILTVIISKNLTLPIIIANIAFHGSIAILAQALYQQTEKTIEFDGIGYFSTGGYVFTMMIAVVYSTIIISLFTTFPMNCQQLDEKTSNIFTKINKPFKTSREKTQKRSQASSTIFGSTFNDLFDASKDIKITLPKEESKFLTKIKTRKDNLIDKAREENEKLNNTICDYILSNINEKLQSPTIQYSLILLIVVLIYPILRIITRLLSIIGFTIFEISFIAKLYTIKKEKKEVERIG